MLHRPAMLKQVLELLVECPDGVFVDATVGAGGHLIGISERFKNKFEYFGFDLDGLILGRTRESVAEIGLEASLIKANYATVATHLQKNNINTISAALFDLGIGSYQVDNPDRGFSYLQDGPLSMSFDTDYNNLAGDLIGRLSEKQLVKIYRDFGQERKAVKIARELKNSPVPVTTTGQLAKIIRRITGDRYFIKTASRVFQALRIAVNNEFDNIETGINDAIRMLQPGGRVMAITYHSLEDGLVKRIFRKAAGKCLCPAGTAKCVCGAEKLVRLVNRKPIVADAKEIRLNSRARSAKLRTVERIETAA